jgi:hypothetical protein
MKTFSLLCMLAAVALLGAGCSKASTIASEGNAAKQPLIQRRTAQPPTPPANIPLPTPVQTTGTTNP